MSNEFSWGDKASVVIKRVDAIAVYTNPNGDIVIRQQDSMGEDDSVIVIPLDRVEELVQAICAEKDLAQEPDELEDPNR